ncbi:PRD domain-containing protein [Lentibacillus salicampi]|uniref:PRD domain-containing protein n=1 Tax=Lentibacillus salicampi TaxID=175306 RepID=A0A4Y9ACC3_9BACI|nr:PRD domain-containing protein [Lentibacillus salicampi]
MYLSGRERKMLEYLLEAQGAVTIKTIADRLDVSERTVQRDLSNVEQMLFDYNLELNKQSGVGLQISGLATDKNHLLAEITETSWSEFTPEERQAILLSTLLETDEPVKLFALAANLHVTTATVSHDLDQLENKLTNHKLHLIRRRGYGIRIEGREADKRAAISSLIAEHVNTSDMVSFLKQRTQAPKMNAISDRLLGLVNPEKLSIIEQRVSQARDKLRYDLADSAYIGLVVHLALAIERLQKGDTIEFDQKYLHEISQTSEYTIAKRLIHDLEKDLDMTIPNDEIGYITMHLMGAKLRVDQHYVIEDSSFDVAYQAKEIIEHVSNRLGKDLTYNITLLNDLVAHLKPSIYRLKKGLTISNPMLAEITRDYNALFKIVQEAVGEVFPDLTFPDDEIAYLVLHFAAILLHDETDASMRALVICSSGIGTAKMLATKLKQQIPEIKQVENQSLFDLERTETDDYDIVVSTIPLDDMANDYILTSPMLTKPEADKVKRAIRKRKATVPQKPTTQTKWENEQSDSRQKLEMIQAYSAAILEVLKSLEVKHFSGNMSLDALLQEACEQLAANGVIQNPENVRRSLIDRQAKSGLGIPGSYLALYHTRTDDVKRPSFTVYALNQPLIVNSMAGTDMTMNTLLVMLAPADADQELLETLSYLSSLIIEEESIQALESGDINRIEQHLSKHFYKWLNENFT